MFLLQETKSKESQALIIYCYRKDDSFMKWDKNNYRDPSSVPVGSVKWFQEVTKWDLKPDYYPTFLTPLLGRKVWQQREWPKDQKVFIKPADRAKRFTGKVTDGTNTGRKWGPFYCSEIVNFINEWRYYIADGKVIFSGWYAGWDEDAVAPPFPEVLIPIDYCGAVDMGETDDGRFLLVEAHEPYSIGWYGTVMQGDIYAEFLTRGYEYMKKIHSKDKVCRH